MSGAKDTQTDGQTDRQRQTIKTLTGTDKQTDKQTYHERPIRGCRFHSSGDRPCQGRSTRKDSSAEYSVSPGTREQGLLRNVVSSLSVTTVDRRRTHSVALWHWEGEEVGVDSNTGTGSWLQRSPHVHSRPSCFRSNDIKLSFVYGRFFFFFSVLNLSQSPRLD